MKLIEFVSLRVKEEDAVLDVGCGNKCYEKFAKKGNFYSIDALEALNPTRLMDLNKEDLPFEENSFDVILLLDIIEHFDKARGFEILEQCKKVCRREIIISTPLEWTDNTENIKHVAWDYNPFNEHKSLWGKSDFKDWEEIEGLLNLQNQFVGIWKI